MLASADDVNTYLPQDKVVYASPDNDVEQVAAERVIKGYLSGTFLPTTLAEWDSPDNTPEFIRAVAGKLTAALMYRKAYSEDVADVAEYAQQLYNEALGDIEMVKDGTVDLNIDEPDGGKSIDLSFYPDSTVPPKFTMDARF